VCLPEKSSSLPTERGRSNPFSTRRSNITKILQDDVARVASLQQLHYGSGRYTLLLLFQGMECAGKNGAVRHVVSGDRFSGM
jgi:polyphosphate kinase 2 (PPK2 family)